MLQNATIFKQGGYSDEDAATLSRVAALYQNVADSEVSAGDAGAFVISQMKAYNLTASEAEGIVDQLNEVSNNFAVSNSDLATGLTKSASALSNLGNTSAETIGLLTAGTEQLTGQASKVGKGLQSIGINIANAATKTGELSYQVGNTTKTISLLDDSTGDMKSSFAVLKDIKDDWDNMNNSQKTAVASALAGKTRFDVFSAIMNQFGDAVSAAQTALDSAGSAENENAKYMESLGAKTSLLTSEFQTLVLGDGGLNSLFKMLVDLGTEILKFANNDVVQAIAVFALLETSLIALTKTKFVKSIATWVEGLGKVTEASEVATTGLFALTTAEEGATVATAGLSGALTALEKHPVILVISALIATVTALLAINEKAKAKQEEFNTTLSETSDEYEKLKDKESLTSAEKDRLTYLQKRIDLTNKLAESQTKLAESQQNAKESDITASAQSGVGAYEGSPTTVTTPTGNEAVSGVGAYEGSVSYDDYKKSQENASTATDKTTSSIEKQVQAYKDSQSAIANYNDYTEKGITKLDTMQSDLETQYSSLKNQRDALITLKDAGVDWTDEKQNELDVLNDVINSQNNASVSTKTYDDILEEYGQGSEEATDLLKDMADEVGLSTDEFVAQANALGIGADATLEYLSSMNDFNNSLDSLQSTYSTLSEAQDEYDKNGYYSIDTMQSLLAINDEYNGALQLTNGQLSLNEEAIRNKVIAQAEEAKQTIYNTAIDKLNAIANGENATSTDTLSSSKGASVANIQAQTEALKNNNYQTAINNALQAQGQGAQGDVNKVTTWVTQSISLIDKSVEGLGKNFAGTMGGASKSASKSASDSKDAWVDAFKDEKDALDNLHETGKLSDEDYYNKLSELNEKYYGESSGKHEKYLKEYRENEEDVYKGLEKARKDALEAEKDAYDSAIDAIKNKIEKQIDLLEKQKKAETDAIDKQIDSLNKQKDARDDYYDKLLSDMEDANNARSDAIKLEEAQQALAEAQATKVAVMGKSGWEYRSDEDAVSSASADLANTQYEIDYQNQINAINAMKDSEDDYYDNKIEKLNESKDATEDYYDNQEEYYKNLEDLFEQQVESYQTSQDNLIAEQLTGIDLEADNWVTRLDNLAEFVNNYNRIQSQLGSGKTNVKSKASFTTSSTKKEDTKAYATGVSSISNNEVAYVDDDPKNAELVLGSKPSGVLMNLSKGSSVINASDTKAVSGILNAISKVTGNSGTVIPSNISNNSTNDTREINYNYNIEKVVTKDVNSFINFSTSLQ